MDAEPDEDVETAWSGEIERRSRQIDSGEVKTVPWEDVRAKLQALLHESG